MHQIIEEKKQEFESSLDHLQGELATLRTGRANPALVEGIMVTAYDSKMDLKSVASISTPDASTITIDPWDKSLTQAIEKAIRDADIGLNPAAEGTIIRISIPPMTEETRAKLVKTMKEKIEEARVSVRGHREKIRDEIMHLEKDKQIGEDEKFKALDELDKITKDYTQKIDDMGSKKEEEIMTV